MEEQLHALLNSELGEGTGNRHGWAALQPQKYTSVPAGLGQVRLGQVRLGQVDVSQNMYVAYMGDRKDTYRVLVGKPGGK